MGFSCVYIYTHDILQRNSFVYLCRHKDIYMFAHIYNIFMAMGMYPVFIKLTDIPCVLILITLLKIKFELKKFQVLKLIRLDIWIRN